MSNKKLKTEEKPPLYTDEEIHTMFDSHFLPMLQTLAQRLRETLHPHEKVVGYRANLSIPFEDPVPELKFETLKPHMVFQLAPLVEQHEEKTDEGEPEKSDS